ncbi:MAG: alpha/beta fold hydrolase [Pseudomonadota bacterium]
MFDNIERRRSRFGFTPIQERMPWIGGDMQTMRNALIGRIKNQLPPAVDRTLVFTTDDDSGDVLIGQLHNPISEKPLLMLVHGLTGCEGSPDLVLAARYWQRQGYPVLRLNLRGAGPTARRCKGFYHAGRSEDLRSVLNQLADEFGARGIVVMGSSLGGNATLKLAGEYGADAPGWLKAVITICAPIDLFATSYQFLRPRNRFYHHWLLTRMKEQCADPERPIPDWARAAAKASKDTYDFDDKFSGPLNGWSGADQYYGVNSANRFMDDIRVPALLITADNDPWVPSEPYHLFDWKRNQHLVPLIAQGGGHCGFHGQEGLWHLQMAERFLDGLA